MKERITHNSFSKVLFHFSYMKRDYFCLGTYPLNITHFSVTKCKEFPKYLYKFLTLFIKKSYLLEITIENLNNLTLLPK